MQTCRFASGMATTRLGVANPARALRFDVSGRPGARVHREVVDVAVDGGHRERHRLSGRGDVSADVDDHRAPAIDRRPNAADVVARVDEAHRVDRRVAQQRRRGGRSAGRLRRARDGRSGRLDWRRGPTTTGTTTLSMLATTTSGATIRLIAPERSRCAVQWQSTYAMCLAHRVRQLRFWMLAHSSRRPTVRWNSIGSSGSAAK